MGWHHLGGPRLEAFLRVHFSINEQWELGELDDLFLLHTWVCGIGTGAWSRYQLRSPHSECVHIWAEYPHDTLQDLNSEILYHKILNGIFTSESFHFYLDQNLISKLDGSIVELQTPLFLSGPRAWT